MKDHTKHTLPSITKAACEPSLCLENLPIRNSAPTVFIGGRLPGRTLPGMFQNSRLSEGKPVFSINHTAFKQFVHGVHSLIRLLL